MYLSDAFIYIGFVTNVEKIKDLPQDAWYLPKMLKQLAGGINEITIRKYEAGYRNPKPKQLLKISDALGISINIFMDFDIETISDFLSLIFKIDEQLDMDFMGKKTRRRSIPWIPFP